MGRKKLKDFNFNRRGDVYNSMLNVVDYISDYVEQEKIQNLLKIYKECFNVPLDVSSQYLKSNIYSKIDYKKSKIEFDYSRYAVNRTRYIDQLSFANHLFVTLKSEPQILKRSLKNGKKIPKKILNEIKNKSELLTYKHSWKKFDMFMIDNNRFLHGREEISKNDVRDIVIIQTLKAKF